GAGRGTAAHLRGGHTSPRSPRRSGGRGAALGRRQANRGREMALHAVVDLAIERRDLSQSGHATRATDRLPQSRDDPGSRWVSGWNRTGPLRDGWLRRRVVADLADGAPPSRGSASSGASGSRRRRGGHEERRAPASRLAGAADEPGRARGDPSPRSRARDEAREGKSDLEAARRGAYGRGPDTGPAARPPCRRSVRVPDARGARDGSSRRGRLDDFRYVRPSGANLRCDRRRTGGGGETCGGSAWLRDHG